jgi:hypothetical protein
MHYALWISTLDLKAVTINSEETPLRHLCGVFRDFDYCEDSIMEIRPGHASA